MHLTFPSELRRKPRVESPLEMLSKLKIQDQTRLKVAYSVFHNAVINESNICTVLLYVLGKWFVNEYIYSGITTTSKNCF